MKTHHTITITVPTKAILYAGAGVLIGAAIGVALAYATVVLNFEVWAPVFGLPLVRVSRPASARRAPAMAAVVPVEPWYPPTHAAMDPHPAIVAFHRTPLPVQAALSDMVERVLREKLECAA